MTAYEIALRQVSVHPINRRSQVFLNAALTSRGPVGLEPTLSTPNGHSDFYDSAVVLYYELTEPTHRPRKERND